MTYESLIKLIEHFRNLGLTKLADDCQIYLDHRVDQAREENEAQLEALRSVC